MPKTKTVTVDLTQQELETLSKLREEEKLDALSMKYDKTSMAKLKKEYIKEFGTDPVTDFVKDTSERELGERFIECISSELLVELYLQHVSQIDINAWFNNTIYDGKEFMIQKLIDKKLSSGEQK
jgi:hypothetical protein